VAKKRKTPQLQKLMERWESLEAELVERSSIKLDPQYQPRNPTLIQKHIERLQQIDRLNEMSDQMVAHLKASKSAQLNPIWLVQVGDDLVLVDGHHRYHAYTRTKRRVIPAKVLRDTKEPHRWALMSSRLANTRGSQVQLHKDEHTEAAWRTLSELTDNGRIPWSTLMDRGYSLRVISNLFSGRPSHSTIQSMVKHLPRVAEEFAPSEGEWPTWRRTRKLLREKFSPEDDEEESNEADRVECLALKLAELAQKESSNIYKPALRLAERMLDDAESAEMKALGYDPSPIEEFEGDLGADEENLENLF
jgi:hypothetical protein